MWEPAGERPRPYDAFVPDLIGDLELELSGRTLRLCEQAAVELGRVDRYLPTSWRPVARFLVRAEGTASSDIEGLRVTPRRLLEAPWNPEDVTARLVEANLHSLEDALARPDLKLSAGAINQWHQVLMENSSLPDRYVGRLRPEQGWIGGTSPLDAVFVPPPPEMLPQLVKDLVRFCNRDDVPVVTQAGIAHAQFETIHPFGDGNGRLGRILCDWTFRHRKLVVKAIPPLSSVIARRPDDYVVGLYRFRQGRMDEWLGWFASVTTEAASLISRLVDDLDGLVQSWTSRLESFRSDSAACTLLSSLPGNPLIDVSTAANLAGVSNRAASGALNDLERLGILQATESIGTGRGRPHRQWFVPEILDLLSGL